MVLRSLLLLPLLLIFTDAASLGTKVRRVRRALIEKESDRWPNGVVPYETAIALNDAEQANVTAAMNAWQRETCVTFRPKQTSDQNWLRLVDGNRCFSLVGRHPQPGAQDLILKTRCRMYGVVLHELGHALGLLHEHNRPDRNDHINLDQSRHFNQIESPNDVLLYQTPYDVQSIMHYGTKEFPENEEPSIKDASKKDMVGNVYYKELSFFDVRAINLHYRCNAHCTPKNCPGSAFLNKTCQCEGPEDYADKLCFNIRGDEECNARADRNHCDIYPVDMRHHCRKACNTCFKHAGHGVHVREKVCKDFDRHCSDWAEDGECQKNPSYMSNSCPRSCGNCTPSEAQLAREARQALSTTARPCFDVKSRRECAFWKRSGNCENVRFRRFMLRNCYRTCSGCTNLDEPPTTPPPCVNTASNSDCEDWKRDGYCQSHQYHEFMTQSCYRTCYCSVVTTTTALPPTQGSSQTVPANCVDRHRRCREWSASGECRQNAAWMAANCRRSCTGCDGQPVPTRQPSCEDNNPSCSGWASAGECSANPNWMRTNCKKSCGVCANSCEDNNVDCPQWASNGECARNADYMNRNCRRSCRQCGT